MPPVLGRLQQADLPPEIDFLRGSFPEALLTAAARRAARLGVGADQVLIAGGAISEHSYLMRFSAFFGCRVIDLDTVPRSACPLSADRLIAAVAAGVLPLHTPDGLIVVQAPQERGSHHLARLALSHAPISERFVLTTKTSLARFVHRHADETLARHAAEALHHNAPQFSAAPRPGRTTPWALAAMLLLLSAGLAVTMPGAASLAAQTLLSVIFIACVMLRLGAALMHRRSCAAPLAAGPRIALPAKPPTYTVIAALYHEAGAVEGLVQSLRHLDYPPEKLDIKIVIEADDTETKAALARLHLGTPFEIVVVPPGGPRTKPRALNAALPFARGSYLVIYDAEDRPERDQLRRALAAFAESPDAVCMQARLTIDNTNDGWLSKLFTAEYAGHFDVFLPGLATFGLPLPLGGSSNHFHTATLRLAGAWDAYNVTEDADLGMRLGRLRLRCGVFSSSTYEEAPSTLRPWLRQRTRWFKGWMRLVKRCPKSMKLNRLLYFFVRSSTAIATLSQQFRSKQQTMNPGSGVRISSDAPALSCKTSKIRR
ncbi:MAG TPA: glycosyltransferase family 2 protein [Xanthobacteraceae bacterium]|nr:glycosyltransferase family 2 protein [Xanthobacteraceae bacterium]